MTGVRISKHPWLPRTLLLAEADDELRAVHSQFLSRHRFSVETAAEGLECLAKLRQLRPDLLIVDQDLPWGGGDGVLGVMREDPGLASIPVVLLLAAAGPRVLEGMVPPPVVRVLTKPFSLAALLESLGVVAWDSPSCHHQRRGILVVDDEPALRAVMQMILEQQGFHVWTAGGGEEALDYCRDHGHEIAAVILDVRMPGLDGPQTLERLREFVPEKPVCFMTGDPGGYEPSDLLRMGACHLFYKPLNLNEVCRVLKGLANESMEELLASPRSSGSPRGGSGGSSAVAAH